MSSQIRVVEVAKKLISYPTVTPQECGIYDYICAFLKDFRSMRLDYEEVKNLFLYRVVGRDGHIWSDRIHKGEYKGDLPHFCFAGHIDVVPPGEGWDTQPFIPEIRGEYLLGRGAQDMKGGVAAFLSALVGLDSLILKTTEDQNHIPPFLISVLLTSDEEGAGIHGTRHVLESLESENLIPDYAIVAEPTCVKNFGDMIKIGRRGSVNGVIRILGKQGHVAYPEKCINPVELLGERLGKIAGHNLDAGDACFAPSKIVITDIRGGIETVNVTPNDLRIMLNVRNNTLTTKKDIQTYIERVLEGLDYELHLTQSSEPFVSKQGGFLAKILSQSIEEIAQNKPVLSTSGGTSDARFFAKYGCEVVEFGVCNDRIHSLNEGVRISDLQGLEEVFSRVLEIFIKGDRDGKNFTH